MSYQKTTVLGNLGKDPELRYTPQGKAVCDFTVAVNGRTDQDETQWFKITCWEKMAENAAKYLAKGNPVLVEGPLHLEHWTDRDNNPRVTLAVTARELQFIGGGNGQRQEGGQNVQSNDVTHTGPTNTATATNVNAAVSDVPAEFQ